ncbi:MAG: hypothetical protein JO141_11090 [Bradyrhizobium sp.]|nr:hypothetical protein [Bradyrhizobium sp.]
MANQAFALSPISARASLPSEEDYEAIREAFMETARGRWFLDEYAKRNRNSDTRMVLDAVARIEQTIAAQKQPPPPVVVDRLPQALVSIRSAVEKAQEAGFAAFTGLRLEEKLAPIRKGSRIIKEISWRWREIGADGRICDLIDSQVAAIEAACTQLAETDPRVALRAAFEVIRNEIDAFRDAGAAAAPPVAEAPAPSPVPRTVETRTAEIFEMPAKVVEPEPANEVEAAASEPQLEAETARTEATAAEMSPEEADAHDEAVLEMVAIEMAAPEPDDVHDLPFAVAESEHVQVTTPPIVEPLIPIVRAHEPQPPMPAARQEPVQPVAPVLQPTFQPSPPVPPEPLAGPSLGSSLIASGILRKPNIPANDPLAPIRRMSQAEKIAFFS